MKFSYIIFLISIAALTLLRINQNILGNPGEKWRAELGTAGHIGYTLQRDTTGIITVRACESENSDEIWVAR